jgi:hypothetical protein
VRISFRRSNSLRVRINPVNLRGERRDAERQPTIPAPEVQHALPTNEPRAAPFSELDMRMRP